MKICKRCGTEKTLEEFSRQHTSKDGRRSGCKDCLNEYYRDYYKGTSSIHAERVKSWNQVNPEYRGKWVESNRDLVNRHAQKRRAMKCGLTLENSYIPTVSELVEFYGSPCLFPKCESIKGTLDHVIPISKGGYHHVSNMQPLCSTHNSSKHTESSDYRPDVIWVSTLAGVIVTGRRFPVHHST